MNKTSVGLFAATIIAMSSAVVAQPALADALSFDSDHDVFVLPDNELTVRYNNKTFAPVKVVRTDNVEPHILTRPVLAALKISEDFSKMTISQTPETITIECYNPGEIGPMGTSRINKEWLKGKGLRQVSYPMDRVAKETGFPLGALQAMKSVMIFEVKPKGGEDSYNLFAFQHNDKLTMFSRQMRSGRADIKNDPPVIVLDLRAGSTKGSIANVNVSPPPAAAQAAVETKPAEN